MVKADLPIKIELEGDEKLRAEAARIAEELTSMRMAETWEQMVEIVAMAAMDNAPYWKGDLQVSIDTEVGTVDGDIAGAIFSDEEHAPFMERGIDPVWPPFEAIQDWALDHDMTPYQLALYLSVNGIEPKKFMEQALLDNEDTIVRGIGAAVAEILEATY